MIKIQLLNDITQNFQEGCHIETFEVYEDNKIVGRYYFSTLEMAKDFFTEEYNDDLVRKEHNTQILSWEIIYGQEVNLQETNT